MLPECRKVMFVIDTLETGGAEQSLFENVSRFRMINPVVCHIFRGEALKNKFISNGIPVYSIGLERKYSLLQGYRQFRRILKKESPDLIVAYLTRSELIARVAGRVSGIPVVGTFVSDLYDRSYNANLGLKGRLGVMLFKTINRMTSGMCKGFIANSEAVKMSNAKHLSVPLEKIEVINRGRDSKKFQFNPPSMYSNLPIRFLNVSRLVPVKGQEELIIAFKKFLKVCPNAILHIIGSGPARDTLSKLIRTYHLDKNVALLGTKTNIMYVMHCYDCFVFPSHSEGFSGVLVEAMFSGLPILASDIPANKELIQHLKTGYLFTRSSVDDIATAMLWFKENRYTAYTNAANAYEHALNNFDQEKLAGKFETHLSKLIAEKS